MKNIAGDESFEQIEGLLVAELVEPRPKLRFVADFLHAELPSCERGFRSQGGFTRAMKSRKLS